MKTANLLKKIISLGGTGEIKEVGERQKIKLIARLGKYTIEMYDDSNYFTALKDGTEYDIGSDYNPSGSLFYDRIKDLQYLLK